MSAHENGTPAAHETLAVSVDVSAVPAQPVGAGRYTIDLVTALAACPDLSLTLWSRRGDARRWVEVGTTTAATSGPTPSTTSTATQSTTPSTTASVRPNTVTVRPSAPRRRPLRLAWEQAVLPRSLRTARVAVHHGPHYTMPERAPVPCVVTIHDLTFVEHPEWHERSKVAVFRRAIRVAARRADALVCVSTLTAERLRERFDPAGRVFVVPHGVDHARFGPDGDTEHDVDIRHALGVREPYVLFVGTIEPRKAVPVLLAAFDRIAPRHPDLSLVLAGRSGWGAAAAEQTLAGMGAGDRVVRLGYVSDDAVPALLRGAAAAAYPAIEEGFGLPALEAMACGVPLVTTAGTAMAEVSRDAAILVAPADIDGLADALTEAIEGGRAVEGRRRLGLEVAARHSWSASAAGHVEAYRWAVSSRAAASQDGRSGNERTDEKPADHDRPGMDRYGGAQGPRPWAE